ncbi:MAG: hypothetical protein M3X11_08930, partial [Acidobacteriota bacterium]|nr:hypothetical protein [Acidobacteriota bacterium]
AYTFSKNGRSKRISSMFYLLNLAHMSTPPRLGAGPLRRQLGLETSAAIAQVVQKLPAGMGASDDHCRSGVSFDPPGDPD